METLQRNRLIVLFEGIAFTILGLLAIAFPVIFTFGFEQFLGWLFVFSGVFQGFRSFKTRNSPGFMLSVLTGLVAIGLGALLIAKPLEGVLTLTILLSSFFFIEGILKIFLALEWRLYRNWGWMLFSGVISLVMAGIIISGFPGTALWVLGLLVGINMIFFGMTLFGLFIELKRKL